MKKLFVLLLLMLPLVISGCKKTDDTKQTSTTYNVKTNSDIKPMVNKLPEGGIEEYSGEVRPREEKPPEPSPQPTEPQQQTKPSTPEPQNTPESDSFIMPDFTNKSLNTVASEFSKYGIVLKSIDYETNNAEYKSVISQSIPAGTACKRGIELQLVLSKGSDTIVMPNLKGKTKEEAETILKNLGMEVLSEAVVDTVTWQSFPEGETVKRGTEVTIA